MAKITFVTSDSEVVTVEAYDGSLMELAVKNGIKGIDGDCGGVCSCGTCHIYVLPEFVEKTGEASQLERDMLELTDSANEFSRLSCQLKVSNKLDGVIVRVAK